MSSDKYDATLGALLLGVLFSGCLWGVSCAQVYHYFRTYYNKDNWQLKTLVALAWSSDTVHQALITHGLYHYTVSNFGRASTLEQNLSTLAIQTAVQEITAFLVQCFFIYRIWMLSNSNKYLTGSISFLTFAQLCIVSANTFINYHSSTFQELVYNNRHLTPASVSISVAADTFIALSMCVLLHSKRSGIVRNQMFSHTNDMVDRLLFMSLGTGLVTGICAITIVITYFALPNSFTWVALFFLLGRLYVNSLLVALNVRGELRRRLSEPRTFSLNFSEPLRIKMPHSPQSATTAASVTSSV